MSHNDEQEELEINAVSLIFSINPETTLILLSRLRIEKTLILYIEIDRQCLFFLCVFPLIRWEVMHQLNVADVKIMLSSPSDAKTCKIKMNEQKSFSIYSLRNQITFISLTACSQSNRVDETGSGWLFVLKLYDSSLFGVSWRTNRRTRSTFFGTGTGISS